MSTEAFESALRRLDREIELPTDIDAQIRERLAAEVGTQRDPGSQPDLPAAAPADITRHDSSDARGSRGLPGGSSWWLAIAATLLVIVGGYAIVTRGQTDGNTAPAVNVEDLPLTPEPTPAVPTPGTPDSGSTESLTTTADGQLPRLVGPGEITALALRHGADGDTLVVHDESGRVLTELSFDGSLFLQQLNYPERLLGVIDRGDEVERVVINTATGEVASLGASESIAQWGFGGQPRPGSRWYSFLSMLTDGSPTLVDLETMTEREVPLTLSGLDSPVISPTDELIAVTGPTDQVHVLDALTFEERTRTIGDALFYQAKGFSPDGTMLLISERGPVPNGSTDDLVWTGSTFDVTTGEITPVITEGFVLGWLSSTEVLARRVDSDENLIISLETGEVIATRPQTWTDRWVGTEADPWQVVELAQNLQLLNMATGESRTTELRNKMEIIRGVGRVPGQRFLWANAGGGSGHKDELSALVIDIQTGDSHEFFLPNEGGFIGSIKFALSGDATQAIAVSSAKSFLMGADGSLVELPAATTASFCDDGRFVLSVIGDAGGELMLYADGDADPVSLGPVTAAFCTGG